MIAATPITPAPKKRTSVRNTPLAQAATSPACGAIAVRIGNTSHQPTATPSRIAMPVSSSSTTCSTGCPVVAAISSTLA